jgi:lipopolysaccharide heptosyltransferase II
VTSKAAQPSGIERPTQVSSKVVPPPNRILVKEVNWLGDLVISLPALRAIRSAWPNAHLAVLVRRELASFFDGARWIDEVIPYALGNGIRAVGNLAQIVGEIRARSFDLAVLFPNSFSSAFWVALAGVPRRAGYMRDGRSPLLTHRASPPADALEAHQVHYWLAMIREVLGIEGNADDFGLDVREPHRIAMRQWLAERRKRPRHPLIAVAPSAAYGPAKEWPSAHYATLIDMLADRTSAECVLVGAPNERQKCEAVAGKSKAGALVAAGETSIGELIALLSLCSGFAGNDSGPMHLAGALGLPTVAIFGSTNPKRTGPMGRDVEVIYRGIECSPCLARTCRFGHYNCLTLVAPEEVADALKRLGALAEGKSAV